ncbi:DUF3024 domain-containing protein [Fulvivirga maritima]|uniref:DUF3024 domain-containing protein n=1 Tax=Fulvivirga maritima TaxID=2904247 RepID=UPI001F16DBF0|nr:DUF3024 domain-containing protein [Fulvivirga maritima]UII26598.1 DUF3024 domain-containing protein [Fulvivirga maritima]
MPLDALQSAETINALEVFLGKHRPAEHIRQELDLSYKIENQSIIIFDIRPHWMNKEEKIESPVAKTTWVKAQNIWKIYWMRSNLKWHGYDPKPKVKTIEEFLDIVEKDAHGCFWG